MLRTRMATLVGLGWWGVVGGRGGHLFFFLKKTFSSSVLDSFQS